VCGSWKFLESEKAILFQLPSDVIAGVMLTKEIYTANLTTLFQLAGAYVHEDMKSGKNWLHLTVMIEENTISETLALNFSTNRIISRIVKILLFYYTNTD